MQKLIEISKKKSQQWMEANQFRLARPDALIQLALLGLVTGFIAGGVIVSFRLLVETTQDYLLPGEGPENYEELSSLMHFLFPVIASILLAVLFYRWAKGIRVLGVARVMERMAYHQGHMTARGFIMQFVGAAIAIAGGHSVGREGPHVHLGACAASLFGQWLNLPNNSIRTLVASGAAAGIAASFNTPLAGVIFALEVIMMEYTLNSFIPVMMAAVVATALSNGVLGGEPAFMMPTLDAINLSELPVFLLLGVVVGACAALFNHLITLIATKTQPLAIWWRIMAAGVFVGTIGVVQPQVLGIGYDSVNAILLGELALASLLILAFMKLLATSICVGLGVPGGMIGPALFIGASLGGAIGIIAESLYGSTPSGSHIGFYALLGMGAMMGASLQAPLAALTAIMELTYNPGIIMPGMLVIVISQLTASEIFNKQSLFVTMLRSNGLDYSINPVLQVLRGVGVASVLDTRFERHSPVISNQEAELLIESNNDWIIVNDKDGEISSLMPMSELAKYVQIESSEQEVEEQQATSELEDEINLLEIPAKRLQLSPISLQANLMQAHEYFEEGAEALFVVYQKSSVNADSRVYGVLTEEAVEAAYRPKTAR